MDYKTLARYASASVCSEFRICGKNRVQVGMRTPTHDSPVYWNDECVVWDDVEAARVWWTAKAEFEIETVKILAGVRDGSQASLR
jgi:hypothetical protein